MAKEKRSFNKNLALMCIVPVLVLVVTMSIMGVTFAWFNDAEETTIASLNLSVSKTFEMTFNISNTALEGEKYIYRGETAYYSDGMLITDVHLQEIPSHAEKAEILVFDKAFDAVFALKMDTNIYNDKHDAIIKKNKVNFTCVITEVSIKNAENDVARLTLPNETVSEEDIKLGFTWFISNGNQYYTPYGTINGNMLTDKGTQNPAINIAKPEDWKQPILIEDFQANGTESFAFHIVFAPEILYWKQYGSKTDYMESAENIYGEVFRSEKWNTVNYYSSESNAGSIYSFKVRLTVDTVTEVK